MTQPSSSEVLGWPSLGPPSVSSAGFIGPAGSLFVDPGPLTGLGISPMSQEELFSPTFLTADPAGTLYTFPGDGTLPTVNPYSISEQSTIAAQANPNIGTVDPSQTAQDAALGGLDPNTGLPIGAGPEGGAPNIGATTAGQDITAPDTTPPVQGGTSQPGEKGQDTTVPKAIVTGDYNVAQATANAATTESKAISQGDSAIASATNKASQAATQTAVADTSSWESWIANLFVRGATIGLGLIFVAAALYMLFPRQTARFIPGPIKKGGLV